MISSFRKSKTNAWLARIAAKIRTQFNRIRSSPFYPQPLAQSCAALPANLHRLRLAHRITVAQLAGASTVSATTIRNLEQHDSSLGAPNPTLCTVLALARALNVGVDELVREERPWPPPPQG